jgi:hypothetical protein
MRDGRWMVDKDIEGVKWVDERLIDPEAWTQPMPSAFVKGADLVNSPFRFATLYLRPAYLLNLLGAAGAAGIYQGYHAPPNVARALYAEKIYGPKVTHTMRELFGGGRNISYVKDRPVSNTTKRVAKGWNTITDERLRMSTGIYYGKKKGVKTREDWEALIEGAAKGDKQAFDTLNEITDRTKKAMVQFDNLTWAEQNILRHAIFIYPWQRGAAVWSIRTLVERPVTSAVLAQIGKDATEDFNDRFTDRVPEWFKNAGYIPLGLDSEGNPKIVNPAGLNTFSTLNSIMHSRVDQLLGPAGEAIVRGVTEKDEFGNEYPSASRAGRWRDAAMDVFMGLPQIAAYKRSQQEKGDKASPDVTDRRSLSGRLDEALAETVLSPGWLDGYGSLITGAALTPRSVNREALLARWYREASPEERAKLQKELVNKALGIQGKLLDRPVALDIRRLVNLQFDLDKRADENQRELGRDITPHERSLLDIGFLAERNLMTGEDVEAAKKQAKRLASEGEHSSFRRELFEEFADPEGRLAEWDESVRRVAALSDTKIVNERLKRLSESGVNDAAVTVPKGTDLKEYARKADAYAREYKDRVLEIAQLRKTDPDQVAAAEAELVAWKSEQDQPVRVNGRVLPSPARMEWAKEWKFDDRKEAVAALASRPWAAMTKFEKALLGKDVDPKIARAYQQLEELKAEYVRSAPIGAKNVPADFELQAAKYLNRTTKGFYGDWLYSKEPLGVRLQTMRPVLESPNRREWQRLFAELQPAVRAYRDVVRDGGVQHFKDSWKEYVNGNMTFSPEFQSELDMFGIDPAEDLF